MIQILVICYLSLSAQINPFFLQIQKLLIFPGTPKVRPNCSSGEDDCENVVDNFADDQYHDGEDDDDDSDDEENYNTNVGQMA